MGQSKKNEAEAVTTRDAEGPARGRATRSRAQQAIDRRIQRVPFDGPQRSLSIDSKTQAYLDELDLVARWTNDSKSGRKIQHRKDLGYEFLEATGHEKIGEGYNETKEMTGSIMSEIVGTKKDGSPMTSYLMTIPRKIYNDNQARKQRTNDMTDEAIRGGKPSGVAETNFNSDQGGTHVKGIRMNTSVGAKPG
jgi:hypothetical protein